MQRISDLLTPAQILRAEGKTRKASVKGLDVKFYKLSSRSKVHVVWEQYWTGHYASREEAQEAARLFESGLPIEKHGFMKGK